MDLSADGNSAIVIDKNGIHGEKEHPSSDGLKEYAYGLGI